MGRRMASLHENTMLIFVHVSSPCAAQARLSDKGVFFEQTKYPDTDRLCRFLLVRGENTEQDA